MSEYILDGRFGLLLCNNSYRVNQSFITTTTTIKKLIVFIIGPPHWLHTLLTTNAKKFFLFLQSNIIT